MSSIRVKFPSDKDAERALKAAGFSVGRAQRSEPRGVMFGDTDVQKWRNLSADDRDKLDGRLCRHGPAGAPTTVILHSADHIPAKALHAVAASAAQSI